MKFSFRDFFSKSDQIRKKTADLATFTDEIFNRKLHFFGAEVRIRWTVVDEMNETDCGQTEADFERYEVKHEQWSWWCECTLVYLQ